MIRTLVCLLVGCTFLPSVSAHGADGYGDMLPPGAVRRLGTIRVREAEPTRSLEFSRDGGLLVAAAGDRVHVWSIPDGRMVTEIVGSAGSPRARFSPDGKTVVALIGDPAQETQPIRRTPGFPNHVAMFDVASGKLLRELAVENVADFQFDQSGQTLLLAGQTGELTIADGRTGEIRKKIARLADNRNNNNSAPTAPIANVAVSPDGRTAAVTYGPNEGHVLRIWDLAEGRLRHESPGITGKVQAMRFSADSTQLHALADPQMESRPHHVFTVTPGVNVVPDPGFSVRTHDGVARAYGIQEFLPDLSMGALSAMVYDSTGARDWSLATTLALQDLKSGEKRALGGPSHPVYAMAYSPDGKILATAGADAAILLWDTAAAKLLNPADEPLAAAYGLAVSRDNTIVAVGDTRGGIYLKDYATGKPIATFFAAPPDPAKLEQRDRPNSRAATPDNAVTAIEFSPDGKMLAWLSHDCVVRLCDVQSKSQRASKRLGGQARGAHGTIAWTPDGQHLVVSVGAWLYVLTTDGVTLTGGIAPLGDQSVGGAPTGAEAAALAAIPSQVAGAVRLYEGGNWTNPAALASLLGVPLHYTNGGPTTPAPPQWQCAAVMPDGKLAALGAWGTVQLIQTGDLRVVRKIVEADPARPAGSIAHLAFSPDGKRLVAVQDALPPNRLPPMGSSSQMQVIRLWDTRNWEELTPMKGIRGRIVSLTFAAAGKLLLTGHSDSTVLVWDLAKVAAPVIADDPRQQWALLMADEPSVAAKAAQLLAARPAEAMELARSLLLSPADDPAVSVLVKRLGDASFAERLDAAAKLAALRTSNPAAEPILAKTILDKQTPADIASRAGDVLRGLGEAETTWLRQVRCVVQVLELSGTAPARELLEQMSGALPQTRGGAVAAAALTRMKTGKP